MNILRVTALVLGVGLFSACGGDRRCSIRPPPHPDWGLCDLTLGHWAYLAETRSCAQGSGCSCDANCQANELPFSSREECEKACLPQEEPPPIVSAR